MQIKFKKVKTKLIKTVVEPNSVHKRYIKILDKDYPELYGETLVEFYLDSPKIVGACGIARIIGKSDNGEDRFEFL